MDPVLSVTKPSDISEGIIFASEIDIFSYTVYTSMVPCIF
jgi:hypothetical protein